MTSVLSTEDLSGRGRVLPARYHGFQRVDALAALRLLPAGAGLIQPAGRYILPPRSLKAVLDRRIVKGVADAYIHKKTILLPDGITPETDNNRTDNHSQQKRVVVSVTSMLETVSGKETAKNMERTGNEISLLQDAFWNKGCVCTVEEKRGKTSFKVSRAGNTCPFDVEILPRRWWSGGESRLRLTFSDSVAKSYSFGNRRLAARFARKGWSLQKAREQSVCCIAEDVIDRVFMPLLLR